MLTSFLYLIKKTIGLNTFSWIPICSMILRASVLYLFGILLSRINKKILGVRTVLNFVIFITLGSIFASAIINANLFLPVIITISVLMAINLLITMLAFYFPSVERFIKGEPLHLIINGQIDWPAMRENFITRTELLNELQTQLQTRDIHVVKSAILASDGTINFTKK